MKKPRYCSLSFQGILLDEDIPGYLTINIEGRGLLERQLTTAAIPGRDGERVVTAKLAPRVLRVHFLLEAENSIEFQKRLRLLNDRLRSDEDERIQLGDEDGYRIGRCRAITDPPFDAHQGVGSFELFCADPWVRSESKDRSFSEKVQMEAEISVERVTVSFLEEASVFRISEKTTGAIISVFDSFKVGDVLVIDFEKRQILKNGAVITNKLDYRVSSFYTFRHLQKPSFVVSSPSAAATMRYCEVWL